MHAPPMTIVVRENDVIDTLESVAARAGQDHDGFYVNDIIEVEAEGISVVEATARAMSRMDEAEEQNMAIMYFYVVGVLHFVTRDGVWMAPDPAPLTAKQVAVVFDQIRTNPIRENQTLSSYTTEEDDSHKLVTLSGDEITVEGEVV